MHWQFISSYFCSETSSPSSPNTQPYIPDKLLQMDSHVRYAIIYLLIITSGEPDYWIQKDGNLGISTLIWYLKSYYGT